MPSATKSFSDVSLYSSYYAYTSAAGAQSTSTPTTDTSGTVSFTLASLGLPAGAVISNAALTFARNSPLHGTSIRRLTFNGTEHNSVVSGVDVTLQASNSFKWTFKSGTASTSYPAPPASGVASKLNSGSLSITDILLTVTYTIPYTDCTSPSNASVSPSVSEGDATLTFSGAVGGTSNAITGHEVQYAESANGSTWGTWQALKVVASSAGSGSFSVALSGTRGNYRKYQMRTRGAAGADYYSTWKAVSGAIRRNAVPSAPAIEGPGTGGTIYNTHPRILVTVGADADEQAQTISVPGYSPSTAGLLAIGSKIVLRRNAAMGAPGDETIEAMATDALGVASPAASKTFNYAQPTHTDASIVAETTPIKAIHMNELRVMVNNIRAYYGLDAVSWAQAITAGETSLAGWKSHILELHGAIDNIVTMVNDWDASSITHNITAPSWLAIPTNSPSKAAMDQLRAVIQTL